jgi:hypothetical protein
VSQQEPAGREPSPQALLVEMTDFLALLATRAIYDEQPELWELGEQARARTLEDFGHHFRALATLDESVFGSHVMYCIDLFRQRSFPQQWLTDAWRHMTAVMERELPPEVAAEAVRVLRLGVTNAGGGALPAEATDPPAGG